MQQESDYLSQHYAHTVDSTCQMRTHARTHTHTHTLRMHTQLAHPCSHVAQLTLKLREDVGHQHWLQLRLVLLFLIKEIRHTYVAVPVRNRTLSHCIFQPCYRIQSAVVQNFRTGRLICTMYIDLSGIRASSLCVWAPPLMEVLHLQCNFYPVVSTSCTTNHHHTKPITYCRCVHE